jgi:hypothetical protein
MLQKIGTLEIWSLFWWPKITSWKHKTRLVNRVRFWCFSTLKKSKKRPRWPALSSKSDDRNQNHRKWPRNFIKKIMFFRLSRTICLFQNLTRDTYPKWSDPGIVKNTQNIKLDLWKYRKFMIKNDKSDIKSTVWRVP